MNQGVKDCFTFFDRWPTYLTTKGYAATTIKNMLLSVFGFVKHVGNSFMKESRLKARCIEKLQYELKRVMAEVTKKVVIHRQHVLRQKSGKCSCVWAVLIKVVSV